ncbi:MAG: NAD(P)H-hydrate epimerase [Chloroflexota bacterium]|nr:NAD(P)H-hydrate epimerase [Chloroflexota bacterium]
MSPNAADHGSGALPVVTVEQMREVDRLMVDEFGILLLQMMENAGRCLARQAVQMLGGDPDGRKAVILCGRGGNGGGGLVCARRLSTWGADVTVVLAVEAAALGDVPGRQLAILRRMAVPVVDPAGAAGVCGQADLLVDALIGYSLKGAPREPIASIIRAANNTGKPILALDVPSGLNADSGEPNAPTVRANATLTLALPKAGLVQPGASAWVGELLLADISVPSQVYQRLGLAVGPIFKESDIIACSAVLPAHEAQSVAQATEQHPIGS